MRLVRCDWRSCQGDIQLCSLEGGGASPSTSPGEAGFGVSPWITGSLLLERGEECDALVILLLFGSAL